MVRTLLLACALIPFGCKETPEVSKQAELEREVQELKESIETLDEDLREMMNKEVRILKMQRRTIDELIGYIGNSHVPLLRNGEKYKVHSKHEAQKIIDRMEPKKQFRDIYWDHETHYIIGSTGLFDYILDHEGTKITSGHHRLYPNNGEVWGSLGAQKECVINKQGELVGTMKEIGEMKSYIADP